MSIELKIPDVGESIHEVQIGRWLKQEGDSVELDENIVELETDKASMELPAPSAGVMSQILKHDGDTVAVGDVIGYLEEGRAGFHDKAEATPGQSDKTPTRDDKSNAQRLTTRAAEDESPSPKPTDSWTVGSSHSSIAAEEKTDARFTEIPVTPAARRALRAHGLMADDIEATGARIDREDVLQYVEEQEKAPRADREQEGRADGIDAKSDSDLACGEQEEIVPMSLIRRRIAERLVQAQQQAALLTTFNEIDMTAVKQLRERYRESFQQKYGVKLGFTSFFVKAVVDALKEQPGLNAEIREKQIVYRHYYHIGIAIGSARGLVVPVLRFAERLSFADIEQAVKDFALRASDNKLTPHELHGGTFTITNGGVYGSLLSTPIVNPPQSGVLGMHTIQDRPVVRDGQVVIRPMMYVALTYDHRLVDGREAVSFLKRVKDTIEDPSRMLLEA